jgi:hypothetical protein
MRERDEMMRRLAEGPLSDPWTRELILGPAGEPASAAITIAYDARGRLARP